MIKRQFLVALMSLAGALPVAGAANLSTPDTPGFYGGIALGGNGPSGSGLSFGHLPPSEWSRFVSPATEDAGSRTLVFGGYRWRNELALEAAFATSERYALRRTDALGRSGVGLVLPGFADDPTARNWNVDVFGSWNFWRSMSLYGRLGYAQSETVPGFAGMGGLQGEARRGRDGVNYGVGMRYDMTQSLGLKLEYARFGRFPGETIGSSLPETDQLQLGLQYRF